MPGANIEGQVPIFAFPSSLTFYLEDESSHKQVITLFNPYDFPISYTILCNDPGKYCIDSSGCLDSHHRIDIIVRHLSPILRNTIKSDTLRIQVSRRGKLQVIGKRDIPLILQPGLPDTTLSLEKETFVNVPQNGGSTSAIPRQQEFGSIEPPARDVHMFYIMTSLACLFCVLVLPTAPEPPVDSIFPKYLHCSSGLKQICTFIIGLLIAVFMSKK